MKKTLIPIAAFLVSGIIGVSCGKTEIENAKNETNQEVDQVEMTFSATVYPKNAITKSVGTDGITAWAVNEKIAVYYQKTDDTYAKATANVDKQKDGKAVISATLYNAKDGGEVKFVYPASIVNDNGDDIDVQKLYTAQHGTIEDISANFDAATSSTTLKTDGTACSTADAVKFENRVLIGKFFPKFNGAAINGITELSISNGTDKYIISPSSGSFGASGIYVAMLPVSDKEIVIMAKTASQTYGFGGKLISLRKGKLYNDLTIDMLKAHDLSSASFNADEDCFIYQSTPEETGNNIIIANGRKIILSGVNISVNTESDGKNVIACNGDACIVLSAVNALKGTNSEWNSEKAIIRAGESNKTLTICGCGALNISFSGANQVQATCIGSDFKGQCGNICIQSGNISAYMPENEGAVIGAGTKSSCGIISILGGSLKATSGGGGGAAVIGSGYTLSGTSSCTGIVITGGEVTAESFGFGAAIGSAYIDGGTSLCGYISISGGVVNAKSNSSWLPPAAIGSGKKSTVGKITITGTAKVTATATHDAPGIGGATNSNFGDIEISGTANVTASGGNNSPGIGAGSITGEKQWNYGKITISTSGTVTATGGVNGAGIGTGQDSKCGDILITKGTIIATGGTFSAGIGTGLGGTCGKIQIEAGVTVVDAKRDINDSTIYDIGKGNQGTTGTVTIHSSVHSSNGKHYTDGTSEKGFNAV